MNEGDVYMNVSSNENAKDLKKNKLVFFSRKVYLKKKTIPIKDD